MKTIEQFVDFMEGFLDERHQTQAYKATRTNDANTSTGKSSPIVKKAIHKGLLASPTDMTLRGKIKDLAGSVRNRMNVANESSAHPGFKAVQAKVAKKYGKKKAGAIVAAAARNASASAKRKNPKLKRVKG